MLVSIWDQIGIHLVLILGSTLGSVWDHCEVHLGSMWGQCGVNLESIWGQFVQNGINLVSLCNQFGINVGSRWEGPYYTTVCMGGRHVKKLNFTAWSLCLYSCTTAARKATSTNKSNSKNKNSKRTQAEMPELDRPAAARAAMLSSATASGRSCCSLCLGSHCLPCCKCCCLATGDKDQLLWRVLWPRFLLRRLLWRRLLWRVLLRLQSCHLLLKGLHLQLQLLHLLHLQLQLLHLLLRHILPSLQLGQLPGRILDLCGCGLLQLGEGLVQVQNFLLLPLRCVRRPLEKASGGGRIPWTLRRGCRHYPGLLQPRGQNREGRAAADAAARRARVAHRRLGNSERSRAYA